MTRYNIESSSGCGNCYADEAKDGRYVEYAEAMAAVAEERAAILALIDGIEDPYDPYEDRYLAQGFADACNKIAEAIRQRQ